MKNDTEQQKNIVVVIVVVLIKVEIDKFSPGN